MNILQAADGGGVFVGSFDEFAGLEAAPVRTRATRDLRRLA
jgi:hypothetical protein